MVNHGLKKSPESSIFLVPTPKSTRAAGDLCRSHSAVQIHIR